MLQCYNLGAAKWTTVTSTNTVIKLFADKLHELGLCDEYNETMTSSVSTTIVTGTIPIRFPNGISTKLNLYCIINSTSDYYSHLLYVDIENNFILATNINTVSVYPAQNINYFIWGMTSNTVFGDFRSVTTKSSSNTYGYISSTTNIPFVFTMNMQQDNRFVLFPLYLLVNDLNIIYAYDTQNNSKNSFFPKNMFVSLDTDHGFGNIIKTEDGQQYMSLFPHFYYKM